MARHRTLSRGALERFGGRAIAAGNVLFRRCRRRRLEDDRRRRDVDERDRWLLEHGVRGRDRGRAVGRQRRLRRHGRARGTRGHDVSRRRRLQVDRCWTHVAPRRAPSLAGDLAYPHPSQRSRPRLRRGPRRASRPDRRARCLPNHRRRGELGEDSLRERDRGRGRSDDGPDEPTHLVRRVLGSLENAVGGSKRRRGKRHPQIDGRGDTWEKLGDDPRPGFPSSKAR